MARVQSASFFKVRLLSQPSKAYARGPKLATKSLEGLGRNANMARAVADPQETAKHENIWQGGGLSV